MPRRPLRFVIASLVAAAALSAGPVALAGAAAASPRGATTTDAAPTAGFAAIGDVRTGVDDFTFASFDAVYELGRDDARRSVLSTTETLVAVFPEFDQNRGIRRAIPLHYDGHPVDLRVDSVTDAAGTPRPFEVEEDEAGEFLLVTVRADDFVHGEQSYVIRYRQHNVTHEPDDADIDEFYWDVNGTGWAQPFGRVTAELRMTPDVAAGFTGDAACYQGWTGATLPCDALETEDGGAETTVRAEALGLEPYENLTIATGFAPDTFEPRDDSFTSSGAAMAGAFAGAAAALAAVLAVLLRATRWRNHPGRGTIIAQYEPPPGISAMVAADLVGRADRGVTATILERAVAGELRVVEIDRKRYAVDFVGGEAGDADARSVVLALYRGSPVPGSRRVLKARDTSIGRHLLALRQAVKKRVIQSGLRRRPDLGIRVLLVIGAMGAASLSFVFGVVALEEQRGGGWPAIIFVGAILAAVAALFIVADVRPLTAEGRAVRDHLEGLRLYIRLAEADRLRVLQSPSGAMRVDRPAASVAGVGAPSASAASPPADVAPGAVDPDVVLRLNERLLPYAVLFGLEREWADELAGLYEASDRSPEWYAGRSGFNPGAFTVAVASFSSASSTSWSGSSSSSSSSGSSGGGSSGGGGGGGGGGGV